MDSQGCNLGLFFDYNWFGMGVGSDRDESTILDTEQLSGGSNGRVIRFRKADATRTSLSESYLIWAFYKYQPPIFSEILIK